MLHAPRMRGQRTEKGEREKARKREREAEKQRESRNPARLLASLPCALSISCTRDPGLLSQGYWKALVHGCISPKEPRIPLQTPTPGPPRTKTKILASRPNKLKRIQVMLACVHSGAKLLAFCTLLHNMHLFLHKGSTVNIPGIVLFCTQHRFQHLALVLDGRWVGSKWGKGLLGASLSWLGLFRFRVVWGLSRWACAWLVWLRFWCLGWLREGLRWASGGMWFA